MVHLANNESIKIWPTVFNDHIVISYYAQVTNKIHLQLTDNPGRIIKNEEQLLEKGNNQFELRDLEQLPSGTYFLQLINAVSRKINARKLVRQ